MIEVKEDTLTVIKVPAEDVDKVIAKLPKEHKGKIYFSHIASKKTRTAVNTCNINNALVRVIYKFADSSFKSVVNAFISYARSHQNLKVLIIVY
jgi:hypothetical protein